MSFDQWYAVYPRHVAKAAAKRAYDRIVKKKLATHQQLMDGAQNYTRDQAAEDPKFTKHPATWLNGGCWEDEPKTKIMKQCATVQIVPDTDEWRAWFEYHESIGASYRLTCMLTAKADSVAYAVPSQWPPEPRGEI